MDEIQLTESLVNRLLEAGTTAMALLGLIVVAIALAGAIYIVIRVTRSSDKMADNLARKVDADAVQTAELREMGRTMVSTQATIQAMQADNGKKIEAIHATLAATRDTRTAIDTLDATIKTGMESMRAHVSNESAATADKVIAEIKPLIDRLNEIKSEAAAATQQHIESQNALIKRVDHAQEAIINELLRLLQKPPAADPQPVTALAIAPAPPPETPDSAQSGDAATELPKTA